MTGLVEALKIANALIAAITSAVIGGSSKIDVDAIVAHFRADVAADDTAADSALDAKFPR